jgi:aminobenzoyl-glutamate utilization protein B
MKKKNNASSILSLYSAPIFAQKYKIKSFIVNSVEKHKQELIKISDSIWALAETSI